MNIRKSLGLESEVDNVPAVNIPEEGLPVNNEPEQKEDNPGVTQDAPDTEIDAQSDAIQSEAADITGASNDLTQTLVTLETIATILNNAPDEEINETTAQLVDAAIQDINGRFEIETAPELSVEHFQVRGTTEYRKKAIEAVSDRIEQFKKAAASVIDKIVEWLKRFWNWLTLNGKKTEQAFKEAKDKLKDASDTVTLTVPGYQANRLYAGSEFTVPKITHNAKLLELVCGSTTAFTYDGFKDATDWSGDAVLQPAAANGRLLAKQYFGQFVNSGKYVLYDGIGGERVELEIDEQSDRRPLYVHVEKTQLERTSNDLEVKRRDLDQLIDQVGKTLEYSMRGKDAVAKLTAKISVVAKDARTIQGMFDKKLQLLSSYSDLLARLGDVGYTEALRFTNATTWIINNYVKQTEPAAQGNVAPQAS